MSQPIIPPSSQPPLPQAGPQATVYPRTSKAAVASLVLGLVSLPSIILCLGLPVVVLALVFGIVGVVATGRSGGRLKGAGMAWAGILLSLLTVGLMAFVWLKAPKAAQGNGRSGSPLATAESLIIGDSKGTAHGNSEAARGMAAEYAGMLDELDRELFEWKDGEKPDFSVSGGKFITYCHLTEGRCAFLVHVPSYRKYTDDAKDGLADLAWMAAQGVVAEHPELAAPGSELAIGLKGVMLYGAVRVGKVGKEVEATKFGSRREWLEPFFPQPEDEPAEAAADGGE